MLSWILIIIFLIRYRNDEHPPIRDFISPLVTLTLILDLLEYSFSYTLILAISSICFESMADFLMNKDSLSRSLVLFSFGHLSRQLSHLIIDYSLLSLYLCLLSVIILIIWGLFFLNKYNDKIFIGLYGLILTSAFMSSLSTSYILFIISDLIIGYELAIKCIKYRWIRVLLVPFLYWMSQFLYIAKIRFSCS